MTTPSRPTLDELTEGQIDATDAQVLAQIASLYDTLDPVPDDLVDNISFSITLDALHAEIAELQRSDELVGARADDITEAQTVTFTSSTMTTMVTITPLTGDTVRLDGWIAPGSRVAVELRLQSGSVHTIADEDGRFVFDDVPRGLAQFVLRPEGDEDGSGATPIVTPSIKL